MTDARPFNVDYDEWTLGSFSDHAETAEQTANDTSKNPVEAVMAEFNKQYLLVNDAGKAVVFQRGYDPILGRRYHDRLSTRDLATLYMNRPIPVGVDQKGRAQYRTASEVWLRHPERKQFINGVTFDPNAMNVRPGVLNLWEGFAIKPAPGDWSLMRSHIESVICGNDPIQFNYLMGWLARMFQRPGEQGEVAVVLKGLQGIGKGTLAKVLKRIIGHHSLAISNPKHLVGNFNYHLRDLIFLFADEAFFAGDRAHVGALNALITEPSLTIEGKHANAVEVPNYLHVMMASNEDWVVPASKDARRFFVLEVSDSVRNDHTYFTALWKQLEAGGYAAMLHDLLAMDLTDFNVRAVPTTFGLEQQRKLSLPTTDLWWLDCLERGYVYRSKLGLEADFDMWHPLISTELLFASYQEFAKQRNERRLLSRENLGRFFVGIKAKADRWRNGLVGEHTVDVTNPFGGTSRKAEPLKKGRTTGYDVGDLAEARRNFCKATGIPVEWDDAAWPGEVIRSLANNRACPGH